MRRRNLGTPAQRPSDSVPGDAPFGHVNVFTSHVNVGFFHGAALPDPAHLLRGSGIRGHKVALEHG
jgi:hypothetical protein